MGFTIMEDHGVICHPTHVLWCVYVSRTQQLTTNYSYQVDNYHSLPATVFVFLFSSRRCVTVCWRSLINCSRFRSISVIYYQLIVVQGHLVVQHCSADLSRTLCVLCWLQVTSLTLFWTFKRSRVPRLIPRTTHVSRPRVCCLTTIIFKDYYLMGN